MTGIEKERHIDRPTYLRTCTWLVDVYRVRDFLFCLQQFVPEEQKDDKYWERRRKNNVAAKRARDAQRIKMNQIMVGDFRTPISLDDVENNRKKNGKNKMKILYRFALLGWRKRTTN